MVYQDLALCNSIDVTGNLFLGRELVKNYFGFKFLDKKKMHLESMKILKDLSKSKISSNHCFYITFKTKALGVDIPNYLKKEYPNEMTIVLQNQFWDLEINKNDFSVALLFNKKMSHF